MILRTIAVLALPVSLFLTGCSKGEISSTTGYYSSTPEAIAKGAIEKFDLNKDGKLDGAEMANAPHFREYAKQFQQANLTAEYLAGRIAAYQTPNAMFPNIPVKVYWLGNPLAGAEVTATPEDFHPGYPTLTGTTSENGTVDLKLEKGEVPFGIYKIGIAKTGAGLPAKYATTGGALKLIFFLETVGRGGRAEFRLTN